MPRQTDGMTDCQSQSNSDSDCRTYHFRVMATVFRFQRIMFLEDVKWASCHCNMLHPQVFDRRQCPHMEDIYRCIE
jgi:hypothetical protein